MSTMSALRVSPPSGDGYSHWLGELFSEAAFLQKLDGPDQMIVDVVRADGGSDEGVQNLLGGNARPHPANWTTDVPMSPPPPPKDEPSSPLSAFSPRPIQRQSGSPGPIQPVASSSKLPAFDKEADVTYTSSGRLSRRINYAEQAEPQTDSSSREAGPSMPRAKSLKDDSFKGTKPAKRARSSRDTYGDVDESSSQAKNESDAQIQASLRGQTVEIQKGRCKRRRYAKFGLCAQCVAKVAGDLCRFRGWRAFPIDPETAEIVGSPYWPESTAIDPKPIPLPKLSEDAYKEPGLNHMKKVQLAVANALIPVLLRELKVWIDSGCERPTKLRALEDSNMRATCDFCALQIFGGSYPCRTCGRDYCLDCFLLFPRDGHAPPAPPAMPASPASTASTKMSQLSNTSSGPSLASASQRLTWCGKNKAHTVEDLQPVSRFLESQLRTYLAQMAEICLERATLSTEATQETADAIELYMQRADLQTVRSDRRVVQDMMKDLLVLVEKRPGNFKTTCDPKRDPKDPSGVDSLGHFVASVDKIKPLLFDAVRNSGEIIVMKGCHLKFDEDWGRQFWLTYFEKHRTCKVQDAQTKAVQEMRISDFFGQFGRYAGRKDILKLKDFPPSNAFRTVFPYHYDDLMNSLPMPWATRRDGIENIAAYTAKELNPPDIGPKIYAAFAGKETAGGHGTTRLHQDLADAVNIMVYTEDRPDGGVGCAAWNLFRSHDSNKIREFLTKKFGAKQKFEDPIHSQLFYLDSKLRAELFRDFGVASVRIYQYVGQAVFIPAGCSHQVCNLADCVKVAIDFISPQNVSYCENLSREFRNENSTSSKPWKDDVLAYNQTMFNAFLTTLRLDSLRPPPPSTTSTSTTTGIQSASAAPQVPSTFSPVPYIWPLASPALDELPKPTPLPPGAAAKMKTTKEIVEMLMRDWVAGAGSGDGGEKEGKKWVEVRMDRETLGRPEAVRRVPPPPTKAVSAMGGVVDAAVAGR